MGTRTHIPTYYNIVVIFTYTPCYHIPRAILLTLWVSKWSACYISCFVMVIIDSNECRNYAWNSIFGTLCLMLIINPLLECLWDPLHVLFKSPHRHIFCVITLQCVLVGNGTFNQRLSTQLQTQHFIQIDSSQRRKDTYTEFWASWHIFMPSSGINIEFLYNNHKCKTS